jgi:3-oxoacyl-[acyl-carrier-protein] synthase II
MAQALRRADLSPDQIDYVNAHASSTRLNDSCETLAIREVMGARAYEIPVSGTKAYYAHPLGASGAIEAAICCLILTRGWIPPTLNLEESEQDCDLDYVPLEGRCGEPGAILSNSFGFGGINASLVFARADSANGNGSGLLPPV